MSRNAYIIGVLAVVLFAGMGWWIYSSLPASQPPDSGSGSEQRTARLEPKELKESTDRYSIDMSYPAFGVPEIDEQIQRGIDAFVSEFKAEAESAPKGAKYELTSAFDSVYIGEGIVSTRLAVSSYTGGAHPGTILFGLNFAVKDGIRMVLNDALRLLDMPLESVATESARQLSAKLGDSFVPDGAAAREENYQAFTVSKDAVTFAFDEYQVGPYAAGPQGVSLPRKK